MASWFGARFWQDLFDRIILVKGFDLNRKYLRIVRIGLFDRRNTFAAIGNFEIWTSILVQSKRSRR